MMASINRGPIAKPIFQRTNHTATEPLISQLNATETAMEMHQTRVTFFVGV
jgi:hypothetical protein